MPNVLPIDKQIAIIASLCEGSSIPSAKRTTGVHRDTIMRLGVRVEQGCTALMNPKMRNLESIRQSHLDELRDVIHKLHGAIVTHVESVPVKETFHGNTVWDGVVEVFDCHGHPLPIMFTLGRTLRKIPPIQRAMSQSYISGPIISAVAAVRAVILQEFRDAQPSEA